MKVFLLADKPTRDRVEFWNILGKQCDLTVAFEQYADESNIWHFSVMENKFRCIFLPGINLGGGMNVSFGVGNIISENPYDVYVVGDCTSSAQKTAIREIAINKKKFVFASEGGFPDIDESNRANRKKAGYMSSASYFLSCGSACDAYLKSYNVDMSKVYRYNLAAFSEKDFLRTTPMTVPRERGLRKRFRLKENIFISTIDFNSEQGIDILLDIWKFAGIDNADLLIISDAKDSKRLHKMVRNVAINNVVMLDYQPIELTRELIKMSKALIYPARYDAWGLPIVGALSCGTPVISSYNVGAVHDLVHNEVTGYIQNIHEPIAWGERMREMIKRDIFLRKMKENSFNSMRLFTIESRAKTYIDIFKKCAINQNK